MLAICCVCGELKEVADYIVVVPPSHPDEDGIEKPICKECLERKDHA